MIISTGLMIISTLRKMVEFENRRKCHAKDASVRMFRSKPVKQVSHKCRLDARQVLITSCVGVGHSARPQATRVTYTHAAGNKHLFQGQGIVE